MGFYALENVIDMYQYIAEKRHSYHAEQAEKYKKNGMGKEGAMNIKPAWNTKPDMFEGSISNITPQTQQSPLEEVGNGASHSIIEALEEHTVPLFNNNPLHGAMAEMVGGCPVEIRRSVIEKATQYGEADDNALYGLAVFDLYNEHLQPTGAVFTNPTIKGFKDIVFSMAVCISTGQS